MRVYIMGGVDILLLRFIEKRELSFNHDTSLLIKDGTFFSNSEFV